MASEVQINFANNSRKILVAMHELGGALALDLKFYAALIFDAAKRPLVTIITKGKDEAA